MTETLEGQSSRQRGVNRAANAAGVDDPATVAAPTLVHAFFKEGALALRTEQAPGRGRAVNRPAPTPTDAATRLRHTPRRSTETGTLTAGRPGEAPR